MRERLSFLQEWRLLCAERRKGKADMDLNCYFQGIQDKDGVWHYAQKGNVQGSFSDQVQNGLFALEDISWWFRYRADVISLFAERHLLKDRDIFDVGGNGYTTMCMQKKGYTMALLEPSYGACRNAKNRGIRTVICGTLNKENVKDRSIPQILLLDVLEHIRDDTGFLQLMREKLSDDGRILLTVPALKVLWSSEDDAAGHYRRYTVEQLRETADRAGFRVCCISYFFSFLFLPILLVRVGMEKIGIIKRDEKRTEKEREQLQRKQFEERKGLVQLGLGILEAVEARKLKKGKTVRFGSSIICVLEKTALGKE